MVHVSTPRPSIGAAIGEGLGKFGAGYLNEKTQQHQMKAQEKQQQSQQSILQRELQQANEIYTNPDLSPEQKQSYLSVALQNQPEVAKQLGGYLNEQIKENGRNTRANAKQTSSENFYRSVFPNRLQQQNPNQQNPQQQLQQQGQNPQGQANPQDQSQQQLNLNDPSSWTDEEVKLASSFAGQQGEPGIIGKLAENESKIRERTQANRTAKEKEYFKYNEPKLSEIATKQRTLQQDAARYDRMQELFQERDKFPSPLLVGLFSKEGQLNDVAYSLLSPQAQEAVKLIIDSTSGIKDTYGARVTNFDLSTYLKKLPSLLNSAEGRDRVLRDLKIINDVNQAYNRGILDEFDEAGGSDQIPFSVAEKRFDKKHGKEINNFLKEYVNPTKKDFKDRPNPEQYLGKKIEDVDTGEILISDGKTWKLYQPEGQ
jgi:hypothetical protein